MKTYIGLRSPAAFAQMAPCVKTVAEHLGVNMAYELHLAHKKAPAAIEAYITATDPVDMNLAGISEATGVSRVKLSEGGDEGKGSKNPVAELTDQLMAKAASHPKADPLDFKLKPILRGGVIVEHPEEVNSFSTSP